ncbi:sensor histidine kinase [Ferribacterium limneticum]|uniref:sensor histidine kinase n=1 Tax=Ferribacterium limneticum TaxID=76259 RepID=UPI001CF89C27|nr:PAS domain S-box protein [Ferribacterium limneticum]UCV21450.1 PAS domain S-box protein [Ferribacterium limneticum]
MTAETRIQFRDFGITDRHLLAALEGAGLGVWVHEPASGRILWSEYLCRLLGYSIAEAPITLAAWIALVHPADQQALETMIAAATAADAGCAELEFQIRHNSGSWSRVCLRLCKVETESSGNALVAIGTIARVDTRPASSFGAHADEAGGAVIAHTSNTEQMLVEQALRSQLQLTSEIIDSAPGIFYLLDDAGHILRWNKNLETVTGYDGDAISRMGPLAFFEPGIQPQVSKAIEEAFIKGENFLDVPLLTRDGRRIPHYFTGRSIELDGKLCVIGFGVDIAEQKQSAVELEQHRNHLQNLVEERTRLLQHSEARMRSILQASPLAIGVVVERQLREVNEAMTSITGYSAEELNGKSARLLYPSDAEFIRVGNEKYAQIRSSGRGVIETVWRQKTGALRHILLASALIDPGNPALGSSFTAFDITERKLVEQALEANERFLRTFTDALPSMVSHWDKNLHCCFANRAYLEWFGKTPEQMQGKSIREVLGEKLFLFQQPDIEAAIGGEHRRFERTLKKHSGEIGHLLVEYIPERAGQEITGFYAVITDVTMVKRAEAKLADSQQALRQLLIRQDQIRENERNHIARELHDELGQLLTGMHFMVSALQLTSNVTTGQTNQIALELEGYLDETQAVLRRITRDLHPAQLEHGLLPALEVLATDFNGRSGVACRLTLIGPDPQLNGTYATSIFRIVQESLTNVARHAHARSASVQIESTAGYLNLKITDDGQGFDWASPGSNGQSFGLIGMQERTALLGATLNIISAPGKGTVIAVDIPIKRETST